MTSTPASTHAATGPRRPWEAVGITTALLVVEALVLAWLFGGQLFAIPGKRWATFAALLVLGGMRGHVAEHRDAYRSARVSWPLATLQVLAFGGIVAYLAWISAGAPRSMLGDAGELAAGAALAVTWFIASLAVIVPRRELSRRLLGTVLACTAFACAAWHVGDLTTSFWRLTAGTTLSVVECLLTPFAGGPVIRPEHLVIGTPEFLVSIGEPCCGFHGIGLITTLLVGYLWWFRHSHRFPQALLLVPVGALMIWLANAVRIAALILVGIWISPDIAVHGFHSAAGWIAFLGVSLGLVVTTGRIPFFTRAEAVTATTPPPRPLPQVTSSGDSRPPPAGLPATDCILPFLALAAVTLLTQAFTSRFDLLYPVRVIVVAAVLWRLRAAFRGRDLRPNPLAVVIGAVTFAIWMVIAPDTGSPPAGDRDPSTLGQPWSTLWLMFRVAGSTLTVPVAEELFFRGFVTRRCIGEDVDAVPEGSFTLFSWLVSSVSFGLLHGDAWVAGTIAGMLFAAALYTRRNLYDAVVAHATTNALLSGYVIATGSWSRWG